MAPLAWIAALALAQWLAFRHGFANYDTFYALVWGDEIAHGESPDLDVVLPPTPHPLATLAGIVLSPLGDGAEDAVVAIAFLSLAAVGYLTYRLGSEWFNRAVGVLAAAIVLTRVPMLDFGVRAYVDIPYIALVLAALLTETKRPRAGWPVLAILAVAGLLRPEAWLFSAAYLAYLLYTARARPRGWAAAMTALAASAPVVWALSDLAFAGDALYSLTGTQDTVDTLDRETGIGGLVGEAPQRLGEVVREPVLLGGAVGVVLAFALLRQRAALALAFGALAVGAFSLLALGGLAVITRYLLLVGVIVSIFCAVAVFGWLVLGRSDPWRARWMVAAAVVGVLLLAFAPAQANRLDDLQEKIADQDRIQADLRELADSGAFDEDCAPVSVPNTRPVPMLALWLDRRPSEIVSIADTTGYFVEPSSPEVEEEFRLDPNDPGVRRGGVPPGFRELARNPSWELYSSC
ncbi:MAG TPA: glycosyltransferase family 39 protein [Solirubrobacterales bacterium]|nr:glycosyltransferase family 39 protein [Solirubrobacterales bacterium]